MKRTTVRALVRRDGESKLEEMPGYDLGPLGIHQKLNREGEPKGRGWTVVHTATGFSFGCSSERFADGIELAKLLAKHADPERIKSDNRDVVRLAITEAGAKACTEYVERPRRMWVLQKLEMLSDKFTELILKV